MLSGLLSCVLAAQQMVPISQVPRAVQNGAAQYLGPYNPQQMLRLAITLKPPHMAEEEEFLREVEDPASPLFHQYLSEEEWDARFAPSVEDEQAVVDWAQSQSLSITQRFANRLVVDVEAPVAVIEKALAINIDSYQMGLETRFSNDRDPSVPAALGDKLEAILGLNNIDVMHTASPSRDRTPLPVYSPGPAYSLGTHIEGDGDPAKLQEAMAAHNGPGHYSTYGAYDPTDLYSSYAYNYVALQNLGHCCNPLNNPNNSPPQSSIAIAIWGDFRDSDLSGFLTIYPYLAHNVQRHRVDGTPTCCQLETTLDVEWATAMSNSFSSSFKTAQLHVYEGVNNNYSTLLDVLNHALSDGHARVLSISWGQAENVEGSAYINSFHNVFNQLAGQGWTIAASAGDGGSTDDCRTVSADYPGTDPNITAVGGSSLSTSQQSFSSENTWTGGSYGCSQNDGGTGGGCSIHFSAPGYQGGAACSGSKRSVPDIALNSDWVNEPQVVYYNSEVYGAGGTSIAAPEMAGFYAQENAYLLYIGSLVGNTCGPSRSAPCAPMGNGNNYLYQEGFHPFAPHYPFYDITHGCNNNDITRRYHLYYYCANAGYDRVSGWGSANMLQLAWMINYSLAGDGAGPSISISGPPTHHWYNTDQTISWTLSDTTLNGHRANGTAGASAAWDADPGDPGRQNTPGGGSNYYGPQFYSTTGSMNGLSNLSQGCHNAYVRAWDNAGNSNVSHYGTLCLDTVPPMVTITLSGNQLPDGNYDGPVLVTINASDSGSGVASLTYNIDNNNQYPYTGPFYVYLPGYHWMYAFATDVAGNTQNTFANLTIEHNQQFSVSITKAGTGSGTVTSSDGQINCGSTCSGTYYDEQPATLMAAPAPGSVFIGWRNCDLSYGLSCTLTVTATRAVSAIFSHPVALQFVPAAPCRVVDTRNPAGPFGGPAFGAGEQRNYAIPSGPCPGIPANAAAYSLNVTVVPHHSLNFLTTWPTGLTQPGISTLNSYDARIKANAAIVPAGDSASITVYSTDATDVLLDINGYFIQQTSSTLAFFALPPCRVADTRNPNGPLGGPYLLNQQPRDFPILQSNCNIPSTAQAYSFNYTVVPRNQQPLLFLETWPTGQMQPNVSTLNANTGTATANAAIVPAGQGGDVEVYPYGNDTDLIIDVNGYFAPPGSAPNPLSLYVFAPCRVLDTRQNGGPFSQELTVNVAGSSCEVPAAAQGYVLNATVVPSGSLDFLTLWPDGQTLPITSTLNARDGAVTSNMAIVPTTNGSIDAFAEGTTQLILDISSYLAP